ncbi:iron reductase [Amylocystis lapponica]|nr:iron reductase [Amylocystis lapponica]
MPCAGDELDSQVVKWVDVLLACILALYTLLISPRILARFYTSDGLRKGHMLCTHHSDLPLCSSPVSIKTQSVSLDAGACCNTQSLTEKKAMSSPRHVPALAAHMQPIMSILRTSFIGSINVGGASLLLMYFAILLFATLYRTSPITNPIRAAYVAVSQIPLVFVFAAKNNLVSMLVGVAYDQLNYIHRFAGRLLALAANVHAIYFIYRWTGRGTWTAHLHEAQFAWGLAALLSLDVLFFFSLAIWRQRAHNIFINSHIIAAILFIVAACFHVSVAIPYALAGAGIYVLDYALRLVKTRFSTAHVTCIPELHMIRVHIPTLTSGWRAGQHVRVRVLSSGMGILGVTEIHPFSIASASDAPHDGLVLLCKRTGRWTRNLYKIASKEGGQESAASKVRVMVEGPYGGPGNTLMSSFSGALLIAGGSGVSYVLAGAHELVQKSADATSSVTNLDVVWIIHHRECLAPLLARFTALLLQSESTPMKLRVAVFHTRAETSEHTSTLGELPAGLTLYPGRPHVAARLVDVVDRTLATPPLCESGTRHRGVFVGVCGPLSLGESVRRALGDVGAERRKRVGGVELHEE